MAAVVLYLNVFGEYGLVGMPHHLGVFNVDPDLARAAGCQEALQQPVPIEKSPIRSDEGERFVEDGFKSLGLSGPVP